MPDSPPDLSALTNDELAARGWHVLSVARLKKQCNPWACWIEQETPITPQEVQHCLDHGRAGLVETPLWTSIVYGTARISAEENRQRHIRKIAYFVLNEILEPISIDVGCEALGCWPEHLVDDGNHRLAAAMFKKSRTINARVGGGLTDAKRRGLHNPNVFEVELCRRQTQEFEAQRPKSSKALRSKP